MRIITIWGSLKFQREMMEEAQRLSLDGNCVLTPVYPVMKEIEIRGDQLRQLKEQHFKRIELSDAVYVINKDNYIGDSTKLEIEYAKSIHKEIIYYEEEGII